MKLIRPGFVIGFGVGYVLGARAGRERYEQIRAAWAQFTGSPAVQRAAEKTREAAADRARRGLTVVQHGVEKAGSAVKERLHRGEPTEDVIEEVETESGRPPEESPARIHDAFAQGDTGI
jgi:hypothetical protein